MKRVITLAMIAAFSVVGCASSDTLSGNVYTRDQAKKVQTVTYGTITSARVVKIQANAGQNGTTNAIGTLGGAVLGGLIGNTVGGGSGRSIATAAGAILGGSAGGQVENKVSQTSALEMEVRQDNGTTFIVVQKAAANEFYVGQPVRIINGGGKITIAPKQ